jgi:membrane-bound inhibitor of C-type lysozyme
MHRLHDDHSLLRLLGAALLAGLAGCSGMGDRDSLVGPIYYACADRSDFSVTFDNTRGVAVVERADAPRLKLAQQPMGSGFRYGDGANELTGKGRAATWHAAGVPPVPCTAQ